MKILRSEKCQLDCEAAGIVDKCGFEGFRLDKLMYDLSLNEMHSALVQLLRNDKNREKILAECQPEELPLVWTEEKNDIFKPSWV